MLELNSDINNKSNNPSITPILGKQSEEIYNTSEQTKRQKKKVEKKRSTNTLRTHTAAGRTHKSNVLSIKYECMKLYTLPAGFSLR